MTVDGLVERIEPHAKRGERLTLRVIGIEGLSPDATPRRIRVRLMTSLGGVEPAARVRVTANLSPPAAPPLPGAHDFARAAFFERIGAVGYAMKKPDLVDSPVDLEWSLRLSAAIQALRRALATRIMDVLPGERGALATALITGERGAISEETTEAYRSSGLIHILSISGLHMAIMAGAVFASVRFLLALIPALALNYSTKKGAAAAGIAGTLLYLAISGGAAATLRSAIMMVVFFAAIMLGRPAIALRNVALSALLILILFPESLLDAGFQMSFAAVVSLVAAYEALGRHFERIGFRPQLAGRAGLFLAGILLSTVIAGLAVTPLSIYHFHTTQHYAAPANLAAIPVCNLLVMPAALATLVAMPFGLEAWPLAAMGWGIGIMGSVAEWVAGLPGAVSTVAAVPGTAVALVLAGGLWLTLWHHKWRLLGLPLILAGIALAPQTGRPDILIGRGGDLLAVRAPEGHLAAHWERPSKYEIKRWLEYDGDARDPKDARRGRVFRCDAVGCVAGVGGKTIALSRHPASLADDCARAAVLVIAGGDRPKDCAAPAHIYDRTSLRSSGTIALTLSTDGEFAETTVAAARGQRPWSKPPPVEAWKKKSANGAETQPPPYAQEPVQSAAKAPVLIDRLSQFAAPAALLDGPGDVEDWRAELDMEAE